MLFPHSQTRSCPSFRFDLATSTFDTAISLLTSIPSLKTAHQRYNHNKARLKSATPSLQIVSDPALDERRLARHNVSSRAATVGETFACSSPAYGTNHQLHLGRPCETLPSSCHPPLAIRTSYYDLGSPSSRTSLILILPNADCRLFNTQSSFILPVDNTLSQVLDRKNGYPHYTPVHRTTGHGLHLTSLLVLPRRSWRVDATF